MVALDDGDRAAGPQDAPQARQRSGGVGQVLQDEADEDVVEASGRERQREHIPAQEVDVGQAPCPDQPAGRGHREPRDVH
ncbi:MAG TPA: hypothetical protein VHY31_07625 [Streptosporangiaceae bacterium]|nr:hypothetical protein [Streptosporangiaceae bacterium]